MEALSLILAGVFLPLFPFSMVFNAVLARIPHPLFRAMLLIVWPQIGLLALSAFSTALPGVLPAWALATSVLYAFRLPAMRDMGRWTGFLATSAWALLWLAAYAGFPHSELWAFAAGFSVPLAFLALLALTLEHHFGAAYTGLYGGLGRCMPRFSAILVLCVLAATATPLFPSFFIMLQTLIASRPVSAVVLCAIWLIWSWAAARLLQGLIVGPADSGPERDIGIATTWSYAAGLAGLVVAGLILTGSFL